jgi:hypothetical protein
VRALSSEFRDKAELAKEVYEVMVAVADKFPESWAIPFDLACYTCQCRLDEARQWFHKALELGDEKAIKLEALDDPDLAPLLGSQTG